MGIFTNEEKIRREAEKKVRAELALEKTIAEKEAEKMIEEAREEANYILQNAEERRKEILQLTKEEIEREKRKWQEKSEACERLKQTVLSLKKIVRQKNLAHLRNLARSVPPARVRRELIRSNKQLIWLDDIYKAIHETEKG